MLSFSCILVFAIILLILNGTFVNRFQFVENTQLYKFSYLEYEYTMKQTSEITTNLRHSEKDKMPNMKDAKANLTALTWAHAVNNQLKLTEALNDNIDFIEADIVMGKIYNSGPDIPIMAHPPATTSDLSLDSFLLQIKDFNDKHPNKMIGVKLDFKSIEVFEGAMKTLKEKIPQMSYPIWLNADIISGPVNENVTIPVNPEQFFAGCSQFKRAVLSIGWTTNWYTTFNNGSYTQKDTDAMLKAIKASNVTKTGQSITFPVRAGIAANSLNELRDLVNTVDATNDCTLTIWSSQHDFVNIEKLRKLIYALGFDRVYLDVPPELSSQLNLSFPVSESYVIDSEKNGCRKNILFSIFNFTLMSIGIVLFGIWMQKIRI